MTERKSKCYLKKLVLSGFPLFRATKSLTRSLIIFLVFNIHNFFFSIIRFARSRSRSDDFDEETEGTQQTRIFFLVFWLTLF